MIDKFAKDIRSSEARLKDLLNLEIAASNDINTKLNRELEEHVYSMSLNHTKVVKVAEEEHEKQLSDVNYLLADIRENIETEAVEKYFEFYLERRVYFKLLSS